MCRFVPSFPRVRVPSAGLFFFVLAWGMPAPVAGQANYASAILEAARAGDIATVRTLMEEDAALLGVTDGSGMTPLHQAVLGGHRALAALLLDLGADVSSADAQRMTPLHHAAYQGDLALVDLLLARGAEVMAVGRSPDPWTRW